MVSTSKLCTFDQTADPLVKARSEIESVVKSGMLIQGLMEEANNFSVNARMDTVLA